MTDKLAAAVAFIQSSNDPVICKATGYTAATVPHTWDIERLSRFLREEARLFHRRGENLTITLCRIDGEQHVLTFNPAAWAFV
ncbi:hypothetical protein [Brevundimonas sp.]|uniref:hypothetical protein n=1 Tax=Brevundimonas sp. TaxID=1871086 RepID=UPI002FCBB38D